MFRLTISLCICLLAYTAMGQQIRVEPMNWWTGMKKQELQLLVHADDVSSTTASLNYPGVSIVKTHKADSKNYLFLDLLISKTAKPGTFPILFKRNGQTVYNFAYTLSPRKQGSSQVKGFNSSDVIYLITPDRFSNGDTGNDIVSTMREKRLDRKHDYARHGGDIRGIINNLDYIRDMGFTAIWPTPMLENNMNNSSYHGYAITDFYGVDPRFGTLEEYRELADKARQKNIKLIFDDVVNHSGSNYWWMSDLPFRNWINYPDSARNTNHRRTTHQDAYASRADRELMVNGWFVRSMPDLNQANPFLANYRIQNSIWWIETLGLAGIRQDTYPYSRQEFLSEWTCRIMNEYPDFNIVGEEWSTNPLVVAYWQQGKTKNNGCLRSTMDFPLQSALVKALVDTESWDKGLNNLYEALANDFVYVNPKDILVFGDNHDMDRLFTQVKKDVDLHQMALGYLLTIRGIPQVYYGTEVLMDNSAKPNDHGLIRSDFPGGWPGDSVNAFSGNNISMDQLRVQSFTKKLLNWRKNKTVIHEGKTMHFAPDKGTYVYFRYDGKDTVMVILNKNTSDSNLLLNRFAEIVGNKKKGRNVINDDQVELDRELVVPARSILILELN